MVILKPMPANENGIEAPYVWSASSDFKELSHGGMEEFFGLLVEYCVVFFGLDYSIRLYTSAYFKFV